MSYLSENTSSTMIDTALPVITERATAHCPCCHSKAEFKYIGEQHWPEKYAKVLNIPMQVSLWLCGNCETTVTGETLGRP